MSGPKKRMKEDGYNLDLTYIGDGHRIIAMSFPASGISSLFRNDIDDVARFLKEKH